MTLVFSHLRPCFHRRTAIHDCNNIHGLGHDWCRFCHTCLGEAKRPKELSKGCRAVWFEALSGSFSGLLHSFSRVSDVVYQKLQSEFQKCPNLHFVIFWRSRFKNMRGKSVKKGRDWIMEKKERRRRQGRYACRWESATLKYSSLECCHMIFKLWPLTRFPSAVCLLACREVRADTKYTGRQRRPHF